jgi:hypothetical protein
VNPSPSAYAFTRSVMSIRLAEPLDHHPPWRTYALGTVPGSPLPIVATGAATSDRPPTGDQFVPERTESRGPDWYGATRGLP